jgi:hypothetical protein
MCPIQIVFGYKLQHHPKLEGLNLAVLWIELASSVLVYDELGIHEEFDMRRHCKHGMRGLNIFPDPSEATCLAAVCHKDARLITRDIFTDPGTKLVPYKIK